MIAQNTTLSNAKECKIQKQKKKFYPGLTLIGLSGTGPRVTTRFSDRLPSICVLSRVQIRV